MNGILDTAEQATKNILNHLEKQLDLDQINPDQIQIKLNGGEKMVIDSDELKNILNDPEKLKNAIKSHMQGKSGEKMGTLNPRKPGKITDKSNPNFKKLPSITIPATISDEFTEQMYEDLEEAIMNYNDVVEEILDYVDEDQDNLLNGIKTIEEVLTQQNARVLVEFYQVIERLTNLGQTGFADYKLRDLLAHLYEDNVLLDELDGTEIEFPDDLEEEDEDYNMVEDVDDQVDEGLDDELDNPTEQHDEL